MTARTARVARATGTRRGLVAVTVVLAAGPLVVWPPFGTAAAGPADTADTAGPVEAVRSTARSVSFSARVDVEWVDGQGRHSASLDVRAGNGLVRVAGAGSAPQAGSAGALVLGDGWLVFTRPGPGTAPASLPPALEAKYDVERLPGPLVAGRPTDLVVLRTGARIRERLAIDTESGLVLRREMFGPADRPVRTVTVTDLDTSAPKTPKVVAPRAAEAAEKPVAPGELRAAYQMPAELAGGYHRVGTFRRDRVVHVVYSDGFHGLSLFVQPGRLDRRRAPAGSEVVPLGRSEALRYTWAGGEIVTWESGPVVRTVVGDAATAEVMAAARSVPPAPRPSPIERIRSACRDIASVLGAG